MPAQGRLDRQLFMDLRADSPRYSVLGSCVIYSCYSTFRKFFSKNCSRILVSPIPPSIIDLVEGHDFHFWDVRTDEGLILGPRLLHICCWSTPGSLVTYSDLYAPLKDQTAVNYRSLLRSGLRYYMRRRSVTICSPRTYPPIHLTYYRLHTCTSVISFQYKENGRNCTIILEVNKHKQLHTYGYEITRRNETGRRRTPNIHIPHNRVQ